ncbi:MAG: hypothetical protein HUJ98_07920, partial [Bacteroidaceae bacterium]|nr:hypothetical protein [Bacteroidaceae bacterium]
MGVGGKMTFTLLDKESNAEMGKCTVTIKGNDYNNFNQPAGPDNSDNNGKGKKQKP